MTAYSFRLYIVGRSARSLAAETNLRRLCNARLGDDYDIDVVDLAEQPELAGQVHIMAAPMVVRLTPEPLVQVVGDLSDLDLAAAHLGLPETAEAPPERGTR